MHVPKSSRRSFVKQVVGEISSFHQLPYRDSVVNEIACVVNNRSPVRNFGADGLTSMKIAFKNGCLATILLFAPGAVAQDNYTITEAPAFTARGAFTAIVVTDLDASVNWYESMLGLHLVKRGKSTRVPSETAVLSGHSLFVELIHHEGK